ncbi:MAG: sodium-independent anion transporter [Micavibrio sp.]|nr:sodium-independent anion transporter [Micavibrio sp.]
MFSSDFTPKLFSLLRNGYNFSSLKADILAGLTVAIIALPLSMALAIASGTSPDKGLITAVIAGFFISFLGGSRVQIGGPTGAFIVVVFNVIAQHGYDGLILATLVAGLILIIAGYARFGQIIKYIPHPVVTGFTAGIAVIIASSQIKDFLGLSISNIPAEFIDKWHSYFSHINTIDLTTLTVGLSSLLAIILLKRLNPKLPGYLITVIISSAVVYLGDFHIDTIGSRFPDIVAGIPMPTMPDWSIDKILDIIPVAFTIAFLAGLESLLSAMVADGMTGYKHRSNQELIAQGIANIASAAFGGMPATGAIARTATNIKSGGKTPVAGISHAIFILLFMLFAMDIIAFVPLATLSAILFIVAWNMSETHHFLHILRLSKSDRTVMLLTFALTVLVDLTVAIGVGVTLASLLFIHEMSKSSVLRTQGRHRHDLDDTAEDETQRDDLPQGVEVFRLTGPIFFGVAGSLLDTLRAMDHIPSILILRMKLVPYIDVAGLNALLQLLKDCQDKKTVIILSGLQQQPAAILQKSGVEDNQSTLRVTSSYEAAISLAEELIEK